MVKEFNHKYVQEKKEGEEEEESVVETMGTKDAMWFPVMAGVMLCSLYGLIKYFGKDVVNQLFMVYLALCVSQMLKSVLE